MMLSRWLLLLLLGGFVAVAAPPEEEESPFKAEPETAKPAPPSRPEPLEVEEKPAERRTPPSRGGRLVELAAEARRATNPQLKAYFERFVVPFDSLGANKRANQRVSPLPLVWGKDRYPDEFGVAILDAAGKPGSPVSVPKRAVDEVTHFEPIVLDATRKLLALPPAPPNPPRGERLQAVESVLSSTLLSLASMRESGERRGASWGEYAKELDSTLADVRATRVELAAELNDWTMVRELADRYSELYRRDRATSARLNAARVGEAAALASREDPSGLERARTLLAEYESREPGGKAPAAVLTRQRLADQARKLLSQAQSLADTNKTQARTLLATAERIDPSNSDLKDLRAELKLAAPTLVVAVKRRPVLMSPARARFDSEKQVAELLFEGLTEAVPDADVGMRYLPTLAAAPPLVSDGLREVQLGTAAWSDPKLGPVTSLDVAGTLRLVRRVPWNESAFVAGWLADPGLAPDDPTRIRLRIDRGHPHPRELLTFKILPHLWFTQKNARADDEAFARNPIGSGPYRVTTRPNDVDVALSADPRYGSRPGHLGQPFITEVRFAEASRFRDLTSELRAGRVHVVPDVPTPELAKYQAENELGGTVRIVTAADPGRTWTLMLNHRRPTLHNPDIRRALMHAIDREAILRSVFRNPAEPEQFHRILNGPFPPESWAATANAPPLFNRALAASKARSYLKTPGAAPVLELAYPADDPQAALACEQIRQMVDGLTAEDPVKLVLKPQPLPADEFIERVQNQGRYDLAYWPRDDQSVWYPLTLAADLDPEFALPGGRNVSGFLGPRAGRTPADIALGQALAETRGVRDWSGRLKPLSGKIQSAFNEAVPFVPLWELDRHTVLSRSVKIRFPSDSGDADPSRLPPTTLFVGVGGWRLE